MAKNKKYLPTEIGVVSEGSNSTINDYDPPKVHEVEADQDPAVKEQPQGYQNIERKLNEYGDTLEDESKVVSNDLPVTLEKAPSEIASQEKLGSTDSTKEAEEEVGFGKVVPNRPNIGAPASTQRDAPGARKASDKV